MSLITAVTTQKDMRAALSAFLVKYFNGNTHTFGGTAHTFPLCDVTFEMRQEGDRLAHPEINVQMQGSDDEKERKYRGEGAFTRADYVIAFTVFTNTAPSGAAPSVVQWDENDEVQNKLAMLFNGAQSELAATGMRTFKVQDQPYKYPMPSLEYQVSRRMVTFQIELTFPRAD